jgi:hypothetical protein
MSIFESDSVNLTRPQKEEYVHFNIQQEGHPALAAALALARHDSERVHRDSVWVGSDSFGAARLR